MPTKNAHKASAAKQCEFPFYSENTQVNLNVQLEFGGGKCNPDCCYILINKPLRILQAVTIGLTRHKTSGHLAKCYNEYI